jgi:hypothetical protein
MVLVKKCKTRKQNQQRNPERPTAAHTCIFSVERRSASGPDEPEHAIGCSTGLQSAWKRLIVNRSAAAAEEGEDEDEEDEEEDAADGDMGPLSISDANREPACFGATADESHQPRD